MANSKTEARGEAPEGFRAQDTKPDTLDTNLQITHVQSTTNSSKSQQPPSINKREKTIPPITKATKSTPNSKWYIETAAMVSAHATLIDPINVLFQLETLKHDASSNVAPSQETLLRLMYEQNFTRLTEKLAGGAIIVEAGGFASTACWVPPDHSIPPVPATILEELSRNGRPIIAEFLRQIEIAKEKHLYPVSAKYWQMNLMARDPRREYVAGAVRAVIEPFLKMAEDDGVPIWLEAGSARARDVYAYFGFEVVDIIRSEGVDTWCMMKRR